ncbi:hypothetical protein PR202_gb25352 [Eleusine coracana subsp. coracana]|uniref:Uncharacterized protein n=1 Tax=Eleusine coracana subsp. coracana TaxID=191504 RepID=A0AAV5FL55_ELECO|nr:hypothetical protein PR202_gb25307 [Eleusine coracana subsp. coracana]GJN36489.1 hypothetical protein PR202_gb25352 [Eleusine coracana subsp. coracana]
MGGGDGARFFKERHDGAGQQVGMLQNDLIHGWGLEYKLGYCIDSARARSVGVVNSKYVLHRGVPVLDNGGNSAGRAVARRLKKMQIIQRRWNAAATQDESWTDPYAAQPPAVN